jgi:hypothetical protein
VERVEEAADGKATGIMAQVFDEPFCIKHLLPLPHYCFMLLAKLPHPPSVVCRHPLTAEMVAFTHAEIFKEKCARILTKPSPLKTRTWHVYRACVEKMFVSMPPFRILQTTHYVMCGRIMEDPTMYILWLLLACMGARVWINYSIQINRHYLQISRCFKKPLPLSQRTVSYADSAALPRVPSLPRTNLQLITMSLLTM